MRKAGDHSYDLLGPVDLERGSSRSPYVSERMPVDADWLGAADSEIDVGAEEPRDRHDGTRGQPEFLARAAPVESDRDGGGGPPPHSPQMHLLPTGHETNLACATVPQRPQKTRAHRRQ